MYNLEELKVLYAYLDRVTVRGLEESANLQHLAQIAAAEIKKLTEKDDDA